MKLITNEILKSTPRLGYGEDVGLDAPITAKFFTPWSNWTWFMTEYDPTDGTAFGYVIGHEKELGYFNIKELEDVRGPHGLRIERDMYFPRGKTLRDVMEG